ncbi:MAG TPA: helix-turn-helix domain-containing protein [Candidatus Binataceae bacterium]|nr:helix-turn-helix domain-containing protein [Candidatus Binataceae bacterium]
MRKPAGNGGSPLGPQGFGAAGLFSVPRLEELVADPCQVRVLDAHTARVLRTQAIAALNVLNGHDLEIARAGTEASGQQRHDRLLNIAEAAEKLSSKKDWLYRHHRELGFTVRHGRLLRFSELGVEEYIRKRRG